MFGLSAMLTLSLFVAILLSDNLDSAPQSKRHKKRAKVIFAKASEGHFWSFVVHEEEEVVSSKIYTNQLYNFHNY